MRMISKGQVTAALLVSVTLLFGACSSTPESVSEYERSEAGRVQQLKSSLTEKTLDLQQRNDGPGLVALSLQSAERYRAVNAPLARADSLWTASVYEARPALAESYARQAVEVLRDMPPSANKLDRETREYQTVNYATHAANLALRNGDKVDVARGYAELIRQLCNAPVSRVTVKQCDVASNVAYRQVLARLGDPTSRTLTEREEQKEREEVAALAAVADQIRNSKRQRDYTGAVRLGAELSDKLAKRNMNFLAALIELDRAESFRAIGDAASAEASVQIARRRIVEGIGPSMLQLEAKQAAQLALPEYAQRLQDEDAALAGLSTQLGIGSMDGMADSVADPQKLQEKRSALVRTIEYLQSRGAHLSAEYARHRLREVSAAYQTRVADLATERATAQRQRIEDERRDREGWEQLSSAIRTVQSMRSPASVPGANAGAGSSTTTSQNAECRCGSEYVQCLAREARRAGTRYQISNDGRNIVYLRPDGSWSAKRGLNPDGSCGGVVN